jgi:hypothetical protein
MLPWFDNSKIAKASIVTTESPSNQSTACTTALSSAPTKATTYDKYTTVTTADVKTSQHHNNVKLRL